MEKKPYFSIATPCWNSALTIERTIKSILAQKFQDYEYIIVDGGSTDGTIDIIKKYEPQFEGRMKWRSEKDKGLYDAFNKGVERSTGIYCWNVNSDDYIEPDALENIYTFIQNGSWKRLPIISGTARFVSRNGKFLHIMKATKEGLSKAIKEDYIGVIHPATLVPKEVYVRYGAFDPTFKIIGDLDWFKRVYEKKCQFEFMDVILTNMSAGGISTIYDYRKSSKDRRYFLKKHYPSKIERLIRFVRYSIRFAKNKLINQYNINL